MPSSHSSPGAASDRSSLPYYKEDDMYTINNVIGQVLTTSTVRREMVRTIERVIDTNRECMHCRVLAGFFSARLGLLQDAHRHYLEALRLFPNPAAVVMFFDRDHGICIRREDVLYNLAYLILTSGAVDSGDAAGEYVREAQRIANAAFSRHGPVSPRADVYDRFLRAKAVGFMLREPMVKRIEQQRTLQGVPSSIPWAIDDDYELNDPMQSAPLEIVRRVDKLGSYRLGQRRIHTGEFDPPPEQ